MKNPESKGYTAFEGYRCVASGDLAAVALRTKAVLDRGEQAPVLIFDNETSEQVELDFRGSPEDLFKRIAALNTDDLSRSGVEPAEPERAAPRGPGRPKLGVVAREVTLLPRHWDWLNGQPGGASVALRKLVEAARRGSEQKDRARRSQESAYRFLSTMAGNLPEFEEALRAFYAGDQARFDVLVQPWPADVRDHARKLAAVAFQDAEEAKKGSP